MHPPTVPGNCELHLPPGHAESFPPDQIDLRAEKAGLSFVLVWWKVVPNNSSDRLRRNRSRDIY